MSTAIVAALSAGTYAGATQTNTQGQAAAQSQAQASAAGSGNIFAKVTTADSVKGDVKASTLIGKDVYIPKPAQGTSAQASTGTTTGASASATAPAAGSNPMANLEDIGSVGDVILSKDGKVDAVLVDVGGFLGIGTHTVALDWTALHWQMKQDAKSAKDSYLVVQASKKQLENAPAFKEEWLKGATASSYGTNSAAGQSSSTTATQGTTGSTAATTHMSGQTTTGMSTGSQQQMAGATNGSTQTQTQAGASGQMPAATNSQAQQSTSSNAAANATVGGTATGAAAKAQANGYTQANLATLTKKELIGAPVYDAKGDEAGEVSKVIMGTSSNKIEGAVIKVGGFLGIGEKAIEVKADTMTVMTKNNGKDVRIYVDLTQQQLKQLPPYKQ
ncbi:hypothetical protein U879_17705 [Defluviimonas sp. 20V17]|nr:hypothetical protein U879_17705 [Defluviimonas sp. 20V17]GHE02237.1 hypothetical protein GCM10008024_21050 [Allgaiera indica]